VDGVSGGHNDGMKPITRRDMLGQAGRVGAVFALGVADKTAGDDAATDPKPKLKVVVTGGHPGDPEYGCGGTVALLSDAGHEVVILYLNKGEGVSPATSPRPDRVAEATKACGILKARPIFAAQIDAKAIVDNEHYDQFRSLIEAEQPNILLTQWPIDNHRDHRAVSLLTYDVWLRMGKKAALYYYEVSNGEDTVQFAPVVYVDITSVEARKRAACYAHASQAPDKFYALQEMVTRMRGIESGSQHAEGFIHHVQSPAIPLAARAEG
jgi:LmbE family N-acetylglucosaminyl deacetylase